MEPHEGCVEEKSIPAEWQEADGIFIPKEQNSTTISQFRSIVLLNMEGKFFFTVLAKWIARFLNDNSYINTTCIVTIIAKYFRNLHMSLATNGFTTGWQRLEVGIAMDCFISPILFVAAFEVILIGGRQVARGLKTLGGGRLLALRGYMDDITTILQTAPCTA
ncbi:hypothetical protein AOLI_G00074950 [Acnodon oligacanthus]